MQIHAALFLSFRFCPGEFACKGILPVSSNKQRAFTLSIHSLPARKNWLDITYHQPHGTSWSHKTHYVLTKKQCNLFCTGKWPGINQLGHVRKNMQQSFGSKQHFLRQSKEALTITMATDTRCQNLRFYKHAFWYSICKAQTEMLFLKNNRYKKL